MSNSGTKKLSPMNVASARRKPIGISQEGWIRTEPLEPGKPIPFVVYANLNSIDLFDWAQDNRAFIENLLAQHRAILFRDFHVQAVSDFEKFVKMTSEGELLEYRDRSTPRETRGAKIYTSTIYPSDQKIDLHNEGTYWLAWPLKLYFCCLQTPREGGQTPIADVRKVFGRIDPEIRECFSQKKMMLVRNYNDGFGLPWQEVFQTTDKAEVEAYCRKNRIEFRWKDKDRLRTSQIRPAVRKHPHTGEMVWFNHAAFFHVSSLEPALRETLLNEFGEEGLPYNTYYGDGAPIEPPVADHLRDAYLREKVLFAWKKGDILMLDNMSVAHGRESFVGEREVLTAMAESFSD